MGPEHDMGQELPCTLAWCSGNGNMQCEMLPGRHLDGSLFLAAGLTHLDFSSLGDRRDEFITNAGVGALSALTNLKSLNLAGHVQLTPEQGLGWVSECTGLTALDLSGGHAYSWHTC